MHYHFYWAWASIRILGLRLQIGPTIDLYIWALTTTY